jgi:hypothetical protein
MRYELADCEWDAIKPMPPNKLKFDRSQTRIELLPDGGGLLFYRRLKSSIFASRIRLGRWLHTVLNRDSSQHHWVSDSI